MPISVVIQNKQLGTAHALKCAESLISGDFLLLSGDNYIDPHSIGRIKEIKNAMLVKEHPSPSNFGVVLLKDGFVTRIIEKPEHSPSFMVSTGIYSLTKDFFSYIRENDITDAVSSMLASGEHLQAVIADDWQDAIYPWDLLKMNKHLLKDLPEVREGSASRQTIIQGTVRIGKGTTIGPNSIISGPVIIGNDCEIGPNCCIMPNTSLGSRVKVEPFTFIGNSLIMDDTAIGSHSTDHRYSDGAGVPACGPHYHVSIGKPDEYRGDGHKTGIWSCAWRSGHIRAFHHLQKLHCG